MAVGVSGCSSSIELLVLVAVPLYIYSVYIVLAVSVIPVVNMEQSVSID